MDFFKIDSLSSKVNIVIWDSKESYKNHILPYLIDGKRDYKEWMIADTFDGNINVMTISSIRQTENRENYSLEEFLECICHEFVHICQNEAKLINVPIWVWEMLATNLGDPKTNRIVNINVDIDEINSNFDNIENNYNIAYTIGKYLFETYGEDYVFKKLKEASSEEELFNYCFEEAKENQTQKKRG